MAHKKAGSSVKNGRDSAGQRLGVKAGDGQLVTSGSIIVRQRGMTFKAGRGRGPRTRLHGLRDGRREGALRARDPRQEAHPGHPGRGRAGRRRGVAARRHSGDHRRAMTRADGVEGAPVKPDTHPKYFQAKVHCGSCGTEFEVGSHPRRAARRRVQQLPPVLHGQAEHHRHRRPGRALPEAPRAPGPRLTSRPARGPASPTTRRTAPDEGAVSIPVEYSSRRRNARTGAPSARGDQDERSSRRPR